MMAGKELDELIAKKVMGYGLEYADANGCVWSTHLSDAIPTPLFSTDIAAAWEVVEKMKDSDFNLEKDYDFEFWNCIIKPANTYPPIKIRGISAPHAICLAALKAVAP